MGTDKHLQLRASPRSALGKTISYIQDDPTDNQDMAGETIIGRFLPFAIDKNDKRFQAIAIRCAVECEAWGRAIREYAGLPLATATMQFPVNNDRRDWERGSVAQEEEEESSPEKEPTKQEVRKLKRRDSMRAMGLTG